MVTSSLARTNPEALQSALSIERALTRMGWLGDPDDLLAKLGITRDKLRAVEWDDEVSAALETRRDAALNTPWRIEHPQARVRKFITDTLLPDATSLMRAAWASVPYGFSVFELVYFAPDDLDNPLPGKVSVKQIIECPFEWFMFLPDGTLMWRDSMQPCDPRKFIATVRDGSLRKPMGEALLSKAYWPWYFRTHGWKFWAKFLEQAAVPLLYGKTMGEKQALTDLLRTVTSGPVMAVNDTDTIESVDTPGNSPNKFTEFETACTRRIQRLILGQTLTSGTDGGSGNRALGDVHNEVRQEKKRADVLLISKTMQRVVDTLCALNGITEPPKFVMEDGSGLEMERAERDKILVEAGMLRFTPEYLREKYALEASDFTVPEQVAAPSDQAHPPAPADKTPAATHATVQHRLVDGVHDPRPRFTAGQQAIEDEIDRTLDAFVSPIQHKAIASAIAGATSADDLIERLGVALQDADDRQFRQTLERALFAADLMGYGQAQRAAPKQDTQQASAPQPITLNAPITIQMPEQAAPVVNMAAQPAPVVHVHVPEQPTPSVNVINDVQPAPVTVNNAFPSRATQVVERDANDEITRTVTTYES